MSTGFFKISKNTKVNRFLLFLLLAICFWILTKFSREFTATMVAKIQYENIPETAALAENNVHEISFDLTANGFEILFYKFKKPVITIPVNKYYSKDKGSFQITRRELLQMVTSNFNRNLAIKNLSLEELMVNLDPIVLKKVKVVATTEIIFKDGFKPVDSIRAIPDSVTIAGPSGSLKDINTVSTQMISMDEVEKNISETVKLVAPTKEIVSIKPDKVKVWLTVAEFSQGQFTLPVEVINLPPNLDIKMVPTTITVSFDVSVNDFPHISKENFRLVCDYSQRNKEENFMVPFLETKPKNIYNVLFEPKKVDFFVLK